MLWAGAAFVVAAGLMTLIAGPLIGLAAGLVVAVAVFGVARLSASAHYSWGTASVSRVGLEAFVREYARSRKLELRNRWRFHSEHRRLPLPGFADHVLAGEVPGTNLDGLLVLLGDAAEMRSRGVEIAYIVDRPLASDALVVALDPPPAPEAVAALELPDGYSVEVAGAEFCVWRPVTGQPAADRGGLRRVPRASGRRRGECERRPAAPGSRIDSADRGLAAAGLEGLGQAGGSVPFSDDAWGCR